MKETIINWLLDNLFSIITAVFGGGSFYAFWTERSKRKAELTSSRSDALTAMQAAYDGFVADWKEQYDTLKSEVEQLKKKQKEIDQDWKAKMAAVEKKWQTKYNKLKKEFEDYKKTHQ